jgi:hypothetical protein
MIIMAHGGNPERALQQQNAFYEALGRAISQWATVEDEIYHTFRVIIEPGDWVAFAASYHAVVSMVTRLDMIEAALQTSRKHNARLEEWKKLHKKIRRYAGWRARCAHWTVLQDATKRGESGVTMYLRPPIYDFTVKRDERGNTEQIALPQLQQWASHFASLGMEVRKFWRSLEAKK